MLATAFCVLAASFLAVDGAGFCPGERRGGNKECRSDKTEGYAKCGVFFHNLYGPGGQELVWIGAIPDSISAEDQNDPEVQEYLSGVDLAVFRGGVPAARADEQCFTTVRKIAVERLDSCKKTVLNRKQQSGTVGQQLCDQALRFIKRNPTALAARKADGGIVNQQISFFYSSQGSAWTPVTSGTGGRYDVEEPLCCKFNYVGDRLTDSSYYRCDGGDFKTAC